MGNMELNVQIRRERGTEGQSELYLISNDPYVNFAMHLPNALLGDLKTGDATFSITQKDPAPAETPEEEANLPAARRGVSTTAAPNPTPAPVPVKETVAKG